MCDVDVVMLNMATKTTIWESASRPLFLRSVWLQASNAGRGVHQRHYILDYEPRQERQLRATEQLEKNSYKSTVDHSSSLELSDFDPTSDSSEDLFLLGSSKVKYQQQSAQQQELQRQRQHQRRTLQNSRKHSQNFKSLELYSQKRAGTDVFPEVYSRRSSLQDLQSTLSNACCSNPDERLAERVLNWLDLAGKTSSYLQVFETSSSPDMQNGNPAKIQRSLQPRATQSAAPQRTQQRSSASRKNKHGSSAQQHQRPESVKHITIIFNKEGVPVRLNRPARNIDLCALASSPNTVRKLAGSMASARLYEADSSAGGYASSRRLITPSNNNSALTPAAAPGLIRKQRELEAVHHLGSARSAAQRFYEEGTTNMQDIKKQLHIFMPSLPKKGLLSTTSVGEDATSVLSNSWSELGKN